MAINEAQVLLRPMIFLPVAMAGLCLGCASVGGGFGTQASVPFEFPKNQILVKTRIAGRGPFSCIIDTGVNPSAIDLSLAKSLSLQLSAEAGAAEGVGTDTVHVYQTQFDVTLAESPASSIAAAALDLSSLTAKLGQPLHCVLGQSWLGTRVVEINYPLRRLHFGTTAPHMSAGLTCKVFVMRYWMPDDLMPLVAVQVNGVDVPVSLDTGSSGTITLFPLGARRAGIQPPTRDSSQTVTGARGSVAVNKITLASLRLGPIAGDDVQASLRDKNLDEPEGRQGNLGNGFLSKGVLLLDYQARRIRVCAKTEGSHS